MAGGCYALAVICRLMDSNPHGYMIDGMNYRMAFERHELHEWLKRHYKP